MCTRLQSGISKPRQILNLLTPTISSADSLTFKQASTQPHWCTAMQAEIDALRAQGTWTLVPLPSPTTKVIGSTWKYKTKLHSDGSLDRYKARLVAQGFKQTFGLDYTETFSPVAKYTSIRLFFLLSLHRHWPLHQLDVSNAFLHGLLPETVYLAQPPGFVDPTCPSHVCKLHKAIYGLKQAPRLWFAALTSRLAQLGFHSSSADPSLLLSSLHGATTYIIVYVDDLLVTGSSAKVVDEVLLFLQQQFKLKLLGRPRLFLGLELSYTDDTYILHQTAYLSTLLKAAGLSSCKPAATPYLSKPATEDSTPFSNPTFYRQLTGSLQYLTLTRPDIAFAVNQVCQHMHLPSNHHFAQLVRILRYLQATPSFGIPIKAGSLSLTVYSDSDWAGDPVDRKSTSGFCIFLGETLISWRVQKQRAVARSSTEAEYRALASATTEVIWLRRLLRDMGLLHESPATIHCDNVSALAIASHPILHSRTKHIEIDQHFVREHIQNQEVTLQYIRTTDQVADLLTKPLALPAFQKHRSNLTVIPVDRDLAGGC